MLKLWLKPELQVFNHYKISRGIRRLGTLQSPSSSTSTDQLRQSEVELINLFLPFARNQTKIYISSRYGLRITEKVGNNAIIPMSESNGIGGDVGSISVFSNSSISPNSSLKSVLNANNYDLNRTLLQFVDFNLKYMFRNPVVDELIKFIIVNSEQRNVPLGLNKTSYSFLVYYISNYGSSKDLLRLFNIMMLKEHIRPTTTIFNYAMMTNDDSNDLSVTFRLMNGFIKQNLHCDQNTWYILFNKIHNNDLKEILINEMISMKLDLNPIFSNILKWKLKVNNDSVNDVYEWMTSKGIDFSAPTYGYLFNSGSILDEFLKLEFNPTVDDDYEVYLELAMKNDEKKHFNLKNHPLNNDNFIDLNNELIEILGNDLIHDSETADQISTYISNLLIKNKQTSQLNQNSWELIIYFFLKKYRFKKVDEIVSKYGEQGENLFKINIKIINWILWYSMNCKRVSGKFFGVKFFTYLNKNEIIVNTDASTWKILMNFIKQDNNNVKQFELIEKMKSLNFRNPGMIHYAASAKFKECNDSNLVIDWLYDNELLFEEHLPPRAATFLISRFLENDEYENAVNLVDKQRLLSPQAILGFLSYFDKTNQILKGSIFLKLCVERKLFDNSIISDKYSKFKNIRIAKFDETSNKIKEDLIDEILLLRDDLTESKLLTSLSILSESTGIIEDCSVFENEILKHKLKFELSDMLRSLIEKKYVGQENDHNEIIDQILGDSVWYNESDYILISKYVRKLDLKKLTDSSITKIIRFFSYKYQYETILQILNKLEKSNRLPTTKALNYSLFSIFSSTSRIFNRRNEVAVSILEIFSKNGISPDWTTWFIIFKNLTDSQIANEMLSLIIKKSIYPYHILSSAFIFKHNDLGNVEDTINWFHLNNLFQSEINFRSFMYKPLFSCYLKENKPFEAIKLVLDSNAKLHFSSDKANELIEYYLGEHQDIIGAYFTLELYKKIHNEPFDNGIQKLKQFCENDKTLNLKSLLNAMINKTNTDSLTIFQTEFLNNVYKIRENEWNDCLGLNGNSSIIEEAISILKNEIVLQDFGFYKSLYSAREYQTDISAEFENWNDFDCNELITLLQTETKKYPQKLTSQLATHFKNINIKNYNPVSLNELSLFLARSGFFIELSKLVEQARMSKEFEISTFMMNSILYSDMRRNNLRELVTHLKEFIGSGIQTDVSTWYIVLDALKSNNNDITACLLEKGINLEERLFINTKTIKKDLKMDEIDSSLLINGPTKTYQMIYNETENKILNQKNLMSFVGYFMSRNQLYNAIAIINYNNSQSMKLSDWKIYEFLLDKFIDHYSYDDLNNYNNILQRLCQFANPSNSKQSIDEINMKLENKGIDLNTINQNSESFEVVNEVNKVIFHLNWTTEPKFDLPSNDENFINSASYFGMECKNLKN